MQRLLLALAAFALILLAAFALGQREDVHSQIVAGAGLGTPVSIARTSDGRILLADYSGIFVLTPGSASLQKLEVRSYDGLFNPAALTFDPGTKRLFIANYHGNNVLIARLSADSLALEVTDVVGDAATVSPEGVAYEDGVLASANYDGNNVQIFQKRGERWVKHCDARVPNAHGVAFNAGRLFATGLRDREVLKIDVQSCEIESKIGGIGWRMGEFLWPTAIAPVGADRVAVADAHTGYVTILRTDDLQPVERFGGNGPGTNGLNMPYGIWADSGEILVASTFSRRIVAFERRTLSPVRSWDMDRGWHGAAAQSHFLTAHEYVGYVRQNPTIEIADSCYRLAYARLEPCSERDAKLKLPDVISDGHLYFLQSVRGRRGRFITSPQHVAALYFPDGSSKWKIVLIGRDHWEVGSQLVGPTGQLDLSSIEP